jgi:predicted PurR-regulated permease PerM
LFGILGIILAVPFAVIMNILFEDYQNTPSSTKKKKLEVNEGKK